MSKYEELVKKLKEIFNGDHNIPAVFTTTESEGSVTKTLKIRQIEPEFLSRMFSVEGVS